MNPITVKNEHGETIEVKWDDDGNLEIRHPDINKERFGKFHKFTSRINQPQVAKFVKGKGLNPDDPMVKEMLARMGGYLDIDGATYLINAEETQLIFDAVQKNGGIVPNWSGQP